MIKQYPFFIKSTVVLFGLILLVFVLFSLADILIPLAFALLLAILLNPVYNKLQQWHVSKPIAIGLCIAGAFVLIVGVGYFFVSQLAGFSGELPVLKSRFFAIVHELQVWAEANFGLNLQRQKQMLQDVQNSAKPLVGRTVGTVLGTFGILFLLPVYVFLLLFYKNLLLNFMYEVFEEDSHKEVKMVLTQTKSAVQSYMVGLLLEALIVAVLNTTALLILGIKYAVLIGVVGAILNVLPYIGGLIAILLPVLIATITKDGYQTQLFIVGAYVVIQFIDNNFLVPYIVSSKVKINALFSIIIVLLGGALWGVPGMFLSIPFIGVLKIVFDRIPELKPWGKLLGDEVPTKKRVFKINGNPEAAL